MAKYQRLLEHNIPIYEKVKKSLKKCNRAVFEQATGTGKSYIALQAIEDSPKGNKILFVAPQYAIIQYFKDLFSFQSSLKDSNLKYVNLETSTYQALDKFIEKKFDIIIFDEAHRAGAPKWSKKVKNLIKNNKEAKIIAMSATLEDRTDGVDVTKIFGVDICSRYSLVDALNDRVLNAPDYTLAKVDFNDQKDYINANIKELKRKLETAQVQERVEIQNYLKDLEEAKNRISSCLNIPDIIAEKFAGQNLSNSKFIVYCSAGSVEEDNRVGKNLELTMLDAENWFSKTTEHPNVWIYAVHSLLQSRKENMQIIKEFVQDNTEGVKLLFAVDMLNEGLHIKNVDGVIMLRPTESKIVYLQQLGRALSVVEDESKQPIIFDFVSNLTSVDTDLIRNIAREVNEKTATDKTSRTAKKVKTFPFKLQIKNLDEVELMENLQKNLYNFKNRFTFEFEDFYARLLDYKNKHNGFAGISNNVQEDGYPLWGKLYYIRRGNIYLNEKQRAKIEALGISTKSTTLTESWNYFIEKLKKYKEKYGNCNVPELYEKNGYRLGDRVRDVRGKKNLSAEREKELKELGFVFNMREENWSKFIKELKEYKEEYGDCNVPVKYVKDGYKLGAKVLSVRNNKNLIAVRKAELEDLGFVFDLKARRYEARWSQFIEELKKYKEEFGDCDVPDKYEHNGYRLGQNVSRTRRDRNLSKERRRELEDLGFVWNVKERTKE